MNRKRVAYIITRFPTVTETFILREIVELEKQNWEVVLFPLIQDKASVIHPEALAWMDRAQFTPYISGSTVKEFTRMLFANPVKFLQVLSKVIWFNIPSPKFLVRALALYPKAIYIAKRIADENITHIHAHYATHPSLVTWVVKQFTGVDYSITVHAHDIFVQKAMLKPKIETARFIVAISEFNKKHLSEQIGAHTVAKTHIIHCGIKPEWYPFSTRTFDTRKERFEMLNIGSLRDYKGQKYLVEACQLLKQKNINFRCRIVGEGPERQALVDLIHKQNLGNEVELLGFLPEDQIAELLLKVHCYVQPSIITSSGKMEGIPVVLMEALASGVPVIATRISGIPELIRPNQTGVLIPQEDPEALAQAILELCQNYENAVYMAQKGKDLVLQEYTISGSVKHLSNLFQGAINAKA